MIPIAPVMHPAKLPAELPSVVINGSDASSVGDRGFKLGADDGASNSVTLPPPIAIRASSYRVPDATSSLDPAPFATPQATYSARMPYTSVWAGTGGANRYDLGIYDGREFALPGGTLSAITRLAAPGGVGASGDPWSWLDLSEDLAYGPSVWGEARYQRAGQLTPVGLSSQDAWSLSGAGQWDAFSWRVSGVQGDVDVPNATSFLERDLDGAVVWTPLLEGVHQPTVTISAGNQLLANDNSVADTHAYVRALDSWIFLPGWELDYGLGAGILKGETYVDPSLKASYRPAPESEISAGIRSATEYPGFQDLYLSRQLPFGNIALLPQRDIWVGELSGSDRLSSEWLGQASVTISQLRRWLFWQLADPNQGIWQPTNTAYDALQTRTGVHLSAQYQWSDTASQTLVYGYDTLTPLGETHQELSTVYDAELLDGRLAIQASTGVEWAQLSPLALGGFAIAAPLDGWQWIVGASVDYKLVGPLDAYLTVDELPVTAISQPAPDYFAPNTLTVVGLKATF